MVATHRMQPLGSRTIAFLVVVALIALTGTFYAGTRYGYRLDQRLNLVNFGIALFGILYVLFEEEIIALRRQRDVLDSRTRDLVPFAELGNNVAGLVHDLRGDIGGVYAVAEVERLSGHDDVAERLLRYGERLNRRVDAIMYVATARYRSVPEDIDLKTLVESAVYYFDGVNRDLKHAITFETTCDEEIVVHASRATLLVIVENVIRNAIDATEGQPERRIAIEISSKRSTATISIFNTGRPLPFGEGRPIDVRRSGYFRRRYSDKRGGAGIGMVNVIRALVQLDAEMTIQDRATGGVVAEITIPIGAGASTDSRA